MKYFVIFSLFLSLNAQAAQMPSLDMISNAGQFTQNCEDRKCLSLKEAIDLSKTNSFENRVDAIRVYQARQFIKVRVGQLLPSFNLRIGYPLEWFDFVPNLVGFLFPSNWFRLKESKLHAKASEQSYFTLVSNQVNSTESLFYNIHRELVNFQVYKNHWDYLQKLTTLMIERELQGELAPEEVERAKIYLGEVSINKISLENSFSELYASLGYAIDLPNDWDGYQIKKLGLPDLSEIEPIDFDSFIDQILKNSYELKALGFLKKAAKYSKRARAFEFLTPDSDTDSAFGFGYISNINIGKADEEIVKIQTEMMNANLKEALYKTVANYNTSLQIYDEANKALDSIGYVLESYMEDFSINSRIEFEELRDLLQDNIHFQWTRNYAVHGYLLAKANLERLLLSSEFYKDLDTLIPSKKKGKLECYQRKENRRIKKAIERGELDGKNIKFTKKETKWCL